MRIMCLAPSFCVNYDVEMWDIMAHTKSHVHRECEVKTFALKINITSIHSWKKTWIFMEMILVIIGKYFQGLIFSKKCKN